MFFRKECLLKLCYLPKNQFCRKKSLNNNHIFEKENVVQIIIQKFDNYQ